MERSGTILAQSVCVSFPALLRRGPNRPNLFRGIAARKLRAKSADLERQSVRSGLEDPILDALSSYPVHAWNFRFSESHPRSSWPLRAMGSCINPKGASVAFEIFAPPFEAAYELGFVKVSVDGVCVMRREWDGYRLGPNKHVRDEVLANAYWKWIESRYLGNLVYLEEERRNEVAVERTRTYDKFEAAIERL